MKTYILKLSSGVDYKLYDGATLVSDADLATLFAAAGEEYFTFDFNSGTPSALTNFTISDSNNAVVITQASATVAEGPNYKGTWSASATAFDTFDKLPGVAMDESELGFLMGKIKVTEDAAYVGSTIGQPSSLAYVGSVNIQDGAVTTDKIANLNVTEGKLASNSVTTSKIADDAVTTAKIADASVTSDKIDWTTIAEELYYNETPTGSTSSISLSKSISNYRSIDVCYKDDQLFSRVIRVYTNYSTSTVSFVLDMSKSSAVSNTIFVSSRRCEANGQTITIGIERNATIADGNSPTVATSTNLKIYAVYGNKY